MSLTPMSKRSHAKVPERVSIAVLGAIYNASPDDILLQFGAFGTPPILLGSPSTFDAQTILNCLGHAGEEENGLPKPLWPIISETMLLAVTLQTRVEDSRLRAAIAKRCSLKPVPQDTGPACSTRSPEVAWPLGQRHEGGGSRRTTPGVPAHGQARPSARSFRWGAKPPPSPQATRGNPGKSPPKAGQVSPQATRSRTRPAAGICGVPARSGWGPIGEQPIGRDGAAFRDVAGRPARTSNSPRVQRESALRRHISSRSSTFLSCPSQLWGN